MRPALALLALSTAARAFTVHIGSSSILQGPARFQGTHACSAPVRGSSSRGTVALHAKKKSKASYKPVSKAVEDETEEQPQKIFSKAKLSAEVSTPWRQVRLFIYSAFALSALIGGLTAVTQLAAAVSNQPDALPLTQCLQNVGIDFGVVVTCALGFRFELQQQEGLQKAKQAEQTKAKKLRDTKIAPETNEQRVQTLKNLTLLIQDRDVPVGVLMMEAKQDFVVLIGGKEFLKESTLRAGMTSRATTSPNLQVVPVQVATEAGETISDKGFGRPSYFNAPFIGAPADEGQWRVLAESEVTDAERQGNERARKDGVVLVVNSDGKIVRRGLGMPKWDLILEDLYSSKK